MRRLIVNTLELLCNVAIVLILLMSTIQGANTGGFMGAIFGLIGGFIFSVLVFGALFVLMDIADHTRRSADALQSR